MCRIEDTFWRATIYDNDLLHDNLAELQSSTSDIIYSLADQVTYVKKLDTATKVNANAVENLSRIVKNTVLQSHERFQETTRDIHWLNYTLHGQGELYTAIRICADTNDSTN
jgi:hypothetical protein